MQSNEREHGILLADKYTIGLQMPVNYTSQTCTEIDAHQTLRQKKK